MERLPPKSALTQKEKGGGENEKRGTESCSIESFPPNCALVQKEKRRAEEKTRVDKKAPPEPPSRALVTHPPPNLGEEKKVAYLYPKIFEQKHFEPMTAKTAIIGQGGEDEAVEAVQYWSDKTSFLGGEDEAVEAAQYWFDFNHLRLVEQEDEQDKDPVCEQEDSSKTSFLGGSRQHGLGGVSSKTVGIGGHRSCTTNRCLPIHHASKALRMLVVLELMLRNFASCKALSVMRGFTWRLCDIPHGEQWESTR